MEIAKEKSNAVAFDIIIPESKPDVTPEKQQKIKKRLEKRLAKIDGSSEKMRPENVENKLERASQKRQNIIKDKTRVLQELDVKRNNFL